MFNTQVWQASRLVLSQSKRVGDLAFNMKAWRFFGLMPFEMILVKQAGVSYIFTYQIREQRLTSAKDFVVPLNCLTDSLSPLSV